MIEPNRWRQLWQQQLLPYLSIGLVVPFVLAAGYGVFSLWQQQQLLLLIVSSLIIAFAFRATIGFYRWHRCRRPQAMPNKIELAANNNWHAIDQAQYQLLAAEIKPLSDTSSFINWYDDWQHIFRLTAERYQCHPLDFSPNQGLHLLGQVAQDYQQQLQQQLPLLAKTRLHWWFGAYQQQERWSWLMDIWRAYRKVRMVTPGGLMKELEARYVTDPLLQKSQQQALRLLHLQMLQAAIQLYGRYSQMELADIDSKPLAPSVVRLRVALVGQVNAGKTSLINALNLGVGETSHDICTPDARLYIGQCAGEEIEFLDQAGFVSSSFSKKQQQDMLGCDLIIWLLQANQPARQLDLKWRQWLASQPNAPHIIGVLTHIDQLALGMLSSALDHNLHLLKLDSIVPLCLLPGQESSLVPLHELLQRNLQQGMQQQLKRRRLQGERLRWADAGKQVMSGWHWLEKRLKR